MTNTLTNQGQISLSDGTNLQLKNTVNNSGAIFGQGGLSTLAGGATLTGGGIVSLDVSGSVIGGVPGSILTIEDQTIEGNTFTSCLGSG